MTYQPHAEYDRQGRIVADLTRRQQALREQQQAQRDDARIRQINREPAPPISADVADVIARRIETAITKGM